MTCTPALAGWDAYGRPVWEACQRQMTLMIDASEVSA